MIMKGSKQEGLCRGEEDHFLTSDESNSPLESVFAIFKYNLGNIHWEWDCEYKP